MDTTTRNALAIMVGKARQTLTEEFQSQLEGVYGIQRSGAMAGLEELRHLPDAELDVASLLRDRLCHLIAAMDNPHAAAVRAVREQAFTILNRFAALRMAEERGITQECVRRGYLSDGFKLFLSNAGTAFGDMYSAYRLYMMSVFDEVSLDLGTLFDRYAASGLLFPREPALRELLGLLDQESLAGVWQEDETIGWIYQFFNSVEERRQMRDASSAPRDTYELAVRNQFFTPRYVVRFLTDNTLGRIWIEMTGGRTGLTKACSLYVPQPAGTPLPQRPLKDPRHITMLDPACGSMHFGLYAFDLFEAIYAEAWDQHPELLSDIRAAVKTREEFLARVPELIIRHNIHGIDIDRRAVQIAGLSLWLRAHKTYASLRIPGKNRPPIRRSGVVCAERMPGEKDLLAQFMSDVRPKVLCDLAAAVWEEMKLAGDVGSLLRVDKTIASLIDRARRAWEAYVKLEGAVPGELFEEMSRSRRVQLTFGFDVSDIKSATSWEQMEVQLIGFLESFAAHATGSGTYQRKLFSEDAADGFAFLDTLRRTYDVILMNPPFGESATNAKDYIKKEYPRTKQDLYAAFIECFLDRLADRGLLGAITSRTGFFLSTFQTWREEILLKGARPVVVADLGYGVLDAMVETAAYCVEKTNENVTA